MVEDAATFAGNATKKAVELATWLSRRIESAERPGLRRWPFLVLADDSGLEVDAIGGAPGVHSARFAADVVGGAKNTPDEANNAKLLRLLKDVPPERRTARFRCVLALTPVSKVEAEPASPVCSADPLEFETRTFEGACEGHIGFAPRGNNGFGYDPLFIPVGHDQTFAELGDAIKNSMSHRGKALALLKASLVA